MRSGGNTDPVAVGNRAAEAWAEADARAVVIAAASADGQAALRGAADAFTDKGKADKARAVAEVAMLAGVVAQMARWLAGLHSSPLLSPKKYGGGWNWKGCQFPPWSRCCKRRQRAAGGRRWRSYTPGYREPLRLT